MMDLGYGPAMTDLGIESQSDKGINLFSYEQQKYITKLSDILTNLPDIGLTDSQIQNAFKSHEELSKIMEPINSTMKNERK